METTQMWELMTGVLCSLFPGKKPQLMHLHCANGYIPYICVVPRIDFFMVVCHGFLGP